MFLGLTLRLSLLGTDVRFHPDEALFAAQARQISATGDLLLRRPDLDKPPLTLYVTALSFRLLGVSEFAARLPNALAASLSVATVYSLTQVLYRRRRISLLAALLCACAPYLIVFAPTVFTDVQATWWVLLAVLLVTRGHWTAAGLSAALAVAAKISALWGVPLILALGVLSTAPPRDSWRVQSKRLLRFALPFAAGIGLLILWDLARWPYSFLRLDYAHNNPGRLIRSDELWPRLREWAHWLSYLTGSPLLTAMLVVLILLWLAGQLRRPTRRDAALDWAVAGYSLAVLGALWLIAFNTYDRYLHLLVPFLLILAARALAGALDALRSVSLQRATGILLILALLAGATQPSRGKTPAGGDRGAHTGIDALAAYLNSALSGALVYDHWLGWELAYYLGEQPQVTLRYLPQPEALADDMSGCACRRYLAAPLSPQLAPWLEALTRAGVQAQCTFSSPTGRFVVYQLDTR